jgi:hypothetical protein
MDKVAAVALAAGGYYYYTQTPSAPPVPQTAAVQSQPAILAVPTVTQPPSVSVTNPAYVAEAASFIPQPRLIVYSLQGQSLKDTLYDVPVTDNTNRRVMHYDEFIVWLGAAAAKYASSPADAPLIHAQRPDGTYVLVPGLDYLSRIGGGSDHPWSPS